MTKYTLTDEHRAQLPAWRDKWIANAMSTAPMTDADREHCVRALFQTSSFEVELDRYPIYAAQFRAALRIAIAANQKPMPMHFTCDDIFEMAQMNAEFHAKHLRRMGATVEWPNGKIQ